MWTLEALREVWRDAPDDDELLTLYLTTAEGQCEAYAPTSQFDATTGAPLPAFERQYLLAVLTQVRNLWNSNRVDPGLGNQYGDEGFRFTVFPMDWTVKNILRPKRAVPVIA